MGTVKMRRRAATATVLVVCCLVCSGSCARPNHTPTDADLARAATKVPRPAYRANSHQSVPDALNGILVGTPGLSTTPCSSMPLEQLVMVMRTIHAARSPEFEAIYQATKDNRRLGTFGKFTSDEKELHQQFGLAAQLVQNQPPLHDHVRDSMCREAVMWWVHHLSDRTKVELMPYLTIPLLPGPGELVEKNEMLRRSIDPHSLRRVDLAANQSKWCFMCHANMGNLVNINSGPGPQTLSTTSAAASLTMKDCDWGPLGKDNSTYHGDGANGCPMWPKDFVVPFGLYYTNGDATTPPIPC